MSQASLWQFHSKVYFWEISPLPQGAGAFAGWISLFTDRRELRVLLEGHTAQALWRWLTLASLHKYLLASLLFSNSVSLVYSSLSLPIMFLCWLLPLACNLSVLCPKLKHICRSLSARLFINRHKEQCWCLMHMTLVPGLFLWGAQRLFLLGIARPADLRLKPSFHPFSM